MTSKRVPERIPFGEIERRAFTLLKTLLCDATNESLSIIDWSKPFCIFVDASEYCVGAVLTQTDDLGRELPIAFASSKLTSTQQRWAVIEKEAYGVLWALKRFRQWVMGTQITVFCDHNPLSFLTETTPKSAKLMRWALALQEFNVLFRYRAGSTNEVADCLSRMCCDKDS